VVNDKPELIVLGTRQNPLRIVNALRDARKDINIHGIVPDLLKEIEKDFPLEMEIANFDWPHAPKDE